MSGCEWNPVLHRGAEAPDPGGNCAFEATLSVGTGKRNFHLCESCAALPEFARLRRRRPLLKPGRVWL